MNEKPWIQHYPPGIPTEIQEVPWVSIPDFFASVVSKFADRPAVANMGTELTYTRLDRESSCLANYLREDLHLASGSRVAIMMPNLLQHAVAILGILKAGLIVVNINPLYSARELNHQLNDSGSETIIILDSFCHVLASVLPNTPVRNIVITSVGDLLDFPKSLVVNLAVKYIKHMVPAFAIRQSVSFKTALSRGQKFRYCPPPGALNNTAVLQYTGGTTGVCKSAVLSHRNLLTNMLQATEWVSHGTPPGKSIVPGQEIVVTALPLYHIFSLTANFLTFMNLGGLVYLITNPRDLKGFVKELHRVPFTCFPGVNTLFNHLIHTPGFANLDFSTLKISLGGGMAVQQSVADQWKSLTGSTLIEAYGLTETSPAVCINPLNLDRHNGSVGLPISSTECTIRDDDGNTVTSDEVGELWVRGPQVMQQYWNRPDETKKILTPDGWLKTGDIARMDRKGYVYLVDRKKDMIIVSGFNVFPNEIESVISGYPSVLECGVIGVDDEECGEAVTAFVVKKDPTLNEQQLIAYCRQQLTAYKVPKSVNFVEDLPKSNVGKILRRELRTLHGGLSTPAK